MDHNAMQRSLTFVRQTGYARLQKVPKVMIANSFEKRLENEIRQRVTVIEDPSYDFGPRFGLLSWVAVNVVIIGCLAAIFLV